MRMKRLNRDRNFMASADRLSVMKYWIALSALKMKCGFICARRALRDRPESSCCAWYNVSWCALLSDSALARINLFAQRDATRRKVSRCFSEKKSRAAFSESITPITFPSNMIGTEISEWRNASSQMYRESLVVSATISAIPLEATDPTIPLPTGISIGW